MNRQEIVQQFASAHSVSVSDVNTMLDAALAATKSREAKLCMWDPDDIRPCAAFTPAAKKPQMGDEDRCALKRDGVTWERCPSGGEREFFQALVKSVKGGGK